MVNRSFFRDYRAVAIPLTLFFFSLPLISCGQGASLTYPSIVDSDQADILTAQRAHMSKVEITIMAPIYKLLRDDTEGIPHQRFLIWLNNGTTVLIAHDLRMARRVPVNKGDVVKIHGEYIWNEKGGVIHWTHHSDTPYHEGGWIDLKGNRYQ